MAFSYSDKNFTVIGNLCFVHIVVQGTNAAYTIPPAIRDRMLFNKFVCSYYSYNLNTRAAVNFADGIGMASIFSGNIRCVGPSNSGYLNFCFHIDYNK